MMWLPELLAERCYPKHQYIDIDTISWYENHWYNNTEVFSWKPIEYESIKDFIPLKSYYLYYKLYNSIHWIRHTLRVIIISSIIANHLVLNNIDKNNLLMAAGVHDTWRINDNADPNHSQRSANIFKKIRRKIYICNIHYKSIYNAVFYHNRKHPVELNKVYPSILLLKAADGLERFRFPKEKRRPNFHKLWYTFSENHIQTHKRLIYLSEKYFIQWFDWVTAVYKAAKEIGFIQ